MCRGSQRYLLSGERLFKRRLFRRNSQARYRMARLTTKKKNVQEAGRLFMLYLVPALSALPRKNRPERKVFTAKVNVTARTAPQAMWLTDLNTTYRWFFRKPNKSMEHDQEKLRKSSNGSEDDKPKRKSPNGDEVSVSWYTCHSSNPAKCFHEQSISPWELAEEPLARTKEGRQLSLTGQRYLHNRALHSKQTTEGMSCLRMMEI